MRGNAIIMRKERKKKRVLRECPAHPSVTEKRECNEVDERQQKQTKNMRARKHECLEKIQSSSEKSFFFACLVDTVC